MTTEIAGVTITGPMKAAYDTVLTPDALGFLAELHREFNPRRLALLDARVVEQAAISQGKVLDFLSETADIRAGDWTVAPIPDALLDRRVEITGPVDRKMIINALNSGAKVFMADFEDATSPTWDALVEGQANVRDAIHGAIDYTAPDGRRYQVNDNPATLLVRPRGWHLPEKHVLVDGEEMSGSLFDFGLYFFHNGKHPKGRFFYIPKLESHLEARLWNDVFNFAQDKVGVPRGSIKATILIETINAAFQMDEILYALRDHIVGLNCGRWDYIFSFIKKHHARPEFVLPDRAQVTMTSHFLRSYSQLLIQTCHRRKAYAMGGMAAQIPIKNDTAANDAAMAKVRADKQREAGDGHDGTWVAHPGLVPIAMEIFDEHMPQTNQLDKLREDVKVTAADLLKVAAGTITEGGLRNNINVSVQYLEAWLGGLGCVPLHNLMEDAATAEISRAQLWQWIRHGAQLDDGRVITADLFRDYLKVELDLIRQQLGNDRFEQGHFARAAELVDQISTAATFADFLTSVAYADLA